MVCSRGGAQTRSLREVYHFINAQLNYLITNKNNVFFVNILDGDEAHRNIEKFMYLITKPLYKNNINNIFVGSMKKFQSWLKTSFTK